MVSLIKSFLYQLDNFDHMILIDMFDKLKYSLEWNA